MTAQETADFLARYNAWRRDEGDTTLPPPKSIGDAIDNAVRLLKEQEEELTKLREDKARIEYIMHRFNEQGQLDALDFMPTMDRAAIDAARKATS